jgi:hypothetical protein
MQNKKRNTIHIMKTIAKFKFMKKNMIFLLILFLISTFELFAQTVPQASLYRVFERSIVNNNTYTNKFIDVDLTCKYTSPSGKIIDFYGFYDGDGKGGGNLTTGNIWKIRFMPNELGEWKYTWKWSDSTSGGEGSFICDSIDKGKGILRAYKDNPRWFAYNGTEPVFLKSYYESSMRPFQQPWDYMQKYYQAYLDNGYNHFQVNWLLPTVSGENIADCAYPSNNDAIYAEKGKASTTMNLAVWNKMETLLSWLNGKNITLFPFLGFDGGRNSLPQAWASLSASEQDFFARYVVARIAPYAIITWNYVWEVEGGTENGELGCMRLVKKYDVFDHLRTYQDEKPKVNHFDLPEYSFAGIENHSIQDGVTRDVENWWTPWSHHEASLVGYVSGKPIYMVEGNALWRRYWEAMLVTKSSHTMTQAEVREAAWGCTMAAGSFTWCGHTALTLKNSTGLPFYDNLSNPWRPAAKAIDLLTDIMNKEVTFYRLTPQDSLLSGHNSHSVWCLAETGKQYMVFSISGQAFNLKLAAGGYTMNKWLNTVTGASVEVPAHTAVANEIVSFTPPDTSTDWLLLIRKAEITSIHEINTPIKNTCMVYPNPFTDQFVISSNDKIDAVKIFNVTGGLIFQSENIDQTKTNISLSNFQKGIYLLYIKSGNSTTIEKIIKN